MNNKTFNIVFDEMNNQEVQYGFDAQDITDRLQLKGNEVTLDEVVWVYRKFMSHAVDNDLI